MIDQKTVQECRALSIVDVFRRYGVDVKKQGANHVCLCPAPDHHEKTPSCILYAKGNNYYCEGCKTSGDTIAFVQLVTRMEFVQAIEDLCSNFHITPIYDKISNPQVAAAKKQEKKDALALVADLHAKYMQAHTDESLEYMATRGFSAEQVAQLQYGFAPKGCRFAQQVFQQHPAIGRALGYVKDSEKDQSQFDFFRHRIIIPIHDHRGNVIAFSGRSIDGSEPKYINSQASELYDKSSVLYGLHRAHKSIATTGIAYLVEGFLDVDAACLRNIPNIVACCGTSITQAHLTALSRAGMKLLTFIPDRDSITEEQEAAGKTLSATSGIQAVLRGIQAASASGIYTQVVDLPQPDVRKKVDLHSYLTQQA